MKMLDSWAVAAAVLIENGPEAKYGSIADWVVETNMTTLGKKGDTPSQTMGAILRRTEVQGKNVFEMGGEGYYSLSDPEWARTIPKVAVALEQMRSSQ